jgi:hypothetical protein
LSSNQPLLSQRGAVVSSNWRNRCRIVETNAWPIKIFDGDRYRAEGCLVGKYFIIAG